MKKSLFKTVLKNIHLQLPFTNSLKPHAFIGLLLEVGFADKMANLFFLRLIFAIYSTLLSLLLRHLYSESTIAYGFSCLASSLVSNLGLAILACIVCAIILIYIFSSNFRLKMKTVFLYFKAKLKDISIVNLILVLFTLYAIVLPKLIIYGSPSIFFLLDFSLTMLLYAITVCLELSSPCIPDQVYISNPSSAGSSGAGPSS